MLNLCKSCIKCAKRKGEILETLPLGDKEFAEQPLERVVMDHAQHNALAYIIKIYLRSSCDHV